MRKERIGDVNGKGERPGDFVLYWMQAAVRGKGNLALDWAVARADELDLPVVALFCLVDDFPSAAPAHYRFLLKGLEEARRTLADRGIALAVARGRPAAAIGELSARAALVVADCGYSRLQRAWLSEAAAAAACRLVRVEGDVVVPVGVASDKEEWSAFTLRRRVTPLMDAFLDAADDRPPRRSSLRVELPRSYAADIQALAVAPPGQAAARAAETRIDRLPGFDAAAAAFSAFLEERLENYGEGRNDPNLDATSRMSAALHFGHISPLTLLMRALSAAGERSAAACRSPSLAAFIEELVVRRELAVNFVAKRDDYDAYSSLPDWARRTLAEGANHPREARYGFSDFENAATHDPYWNAAQDQMVLTGFMHGYMRMYWGKQILAWSATPEEAYRTAILLNDRYSLDGRDPNGYAGVAWCFGKHDRPWTGRPVFGTVRYMNANGLKRKFDADAYVRSIRALKEASCSTTSNTPRSPADGRPTTSKSTRSRPAASARERSLF